MLKTESLVTINAPLEEVYSLAKRIEEFPEFMPDVKSVKITKREGNNTVSEWVGYIKEFARTMKWTEEDVWDDEAHTCKFKQLEGDFTKYEGLWQFEDSPEGTKVNLEIEFDYVVPLIGPLIKKLLTKLVKANADNMLNAMKNKLEGK